MGEVRVGWGCDAASGAIRRQPSSTPTARRLARRPGAWPDGPAPGPTARRLARRPGAWPDGPAPGPTARRLARQGDDIALLAAPTHLLEPDRIADWDVPIDPAAMADVRNAAARKPAAAGLEETAFNTELKPQRADHQRHPLRHLSDPASRAA
ncbi:hypothetical protein [Streptomyces sp. HUAS TT7]|uniref:hypothetical protein n=1 Tax=Streptomyces sp. HUAS TT7 TaxID=3447507 RepID=UPI003F659935